MASWKKIGVCVVIAALSVMVALPAAAHITIAPNQAPADSYVKVDFRVPHGCDGSPTIGIGVQIPEGVTSVTPQVVPGWDITIVTETLAEPQMDGHGAPILERVSEVWWEGGPLADEHLQEFGMSLRLPDQPGDTLYFPVVQVCEEGEHAWIERPAPGQNPHELASPAPALVLLGEQADAAEPVVAAGAGSGGGDGETRGSAVLTYVALVLGAMGTLLGLLSLRRANA